MVFTIRWLRKVRLLNEDEFKKLTASKRDWLIYQLLSGSSKESWSTAEHMKEDLKEVAKQHGDIFPELKKMVDETSVRETIQGIVGLVTAKAVQMTVGNQFTWVPKSAVKNLTEVVLEQGKPVSIDLHTWFVEKVVWKVFD